jgi:hypothetical protein
MKAEDYQGDDPDVEKVSAGPLRLLLHWAGSAIRQHRSSSSIPRPYVQPRHCRIVGPDDTCWCHDCIQSGIRRHHDGHSRLGLYSIQRVNQWRVISEHLPVPRCGHVGLFGHQGQFVPVLPSDSKRDGSEVVRLWS